MSSPEGSGWRRPADLPESCSNYSMLSVEEEVEASQPSQLTGTKSKSSGNIFFDESTRASSNELGISPSPDKSYYKLYTKQSSEVPSLLASASEEDIVPAEIKAAITQGKVQESLSCGKEDSNLPTKDYFSELQQILPPSGAAKRSRSTPEEQQDNLKRVALEWEMKYHESQDEVKTLKTELKIVKKQNMALKAENKELREQLAVEYQLGRTKETEASDDFDELQSRLRAKTQDKKQSY